MTALNPVMTIRAQLYESLRVHLRLRGPALESRAVDLLRRMRVPSPERRLNDYPHQLSGGMRQRIVGAIALSCEPEVLIADEPTSSLDVTLQVSYVKWLREIQESTGLSILFITHDFGLVKRICDRICVMYAGRIVETGVAAEILSNPRHPYTAALIKSVPDIDRPNLRLTPIRGVPPFIFRLPTGCRFAPRCPIAVAKCASEYPPEVPTKSGFAACWMVR